MSLSLAHRETSAPPLEAEAREEALLAEFLFFDREGAPLTGRFATFKHSDGLENFLPVPGFDEPGERTVSLAFRTPPQAASMAVHIWPGRSRGFSVTAPPTLSVSAEEVLRKKILEHQKRGELTAALACAEEKYAFTGWMADARTCAQIRGDLRALDRHWLPRVSSRREPPAPCGEGEPFRIVHLIEGNVPNRKENSAARTHEILAAQAALGMIPLGLTPIGNASPSDPGSPDGGAGRALYEHIAFPASDAWSKLPADEKLRFDTFFSAIALRRFRPHLIHAHWGAQGFELALKGLALRELFGIPLVYDVNMHGIATEATERSLLRKGQIERCMREADAVVVASDAMQIKLDDVGIDASQLHVIPSGDAEAYRGLYARLILKSR